MAVTSLNDLSNQINTTKPKSSAYLNPDNTLTVKTVTPTGVSVTHARVIFNPDHQTVTIGDGSGVRTGNVAQFLASLQ